jgi:hypothetical protein
MRCLTRPVVPCEGLAMRVRTNAVYVYRPCLLDVVDGRTGLVGGERVRVKNLRGCPPCNTMGHAHVVHPKTGAFIGLVSTASLHKKGGA